MSPLPRHLAPAVLVVAAALAIGGCSINPVSGRPQATVVSEEGEIEQGREAAKQVEQEIGLVDDSELLAYVDRIGQRLAKQTQRSELTYYFHIVDMPEPNAFALPGGYVYVSRGLLAVLNSEDELATVLGHELGHIAARHSASRQTASVGLLPIRLATGLGGLAASIVSPRLGSLIAATGEVPSALVLASYSRSQERDADRLGQEYAALAGWRPAALASVMRTLAREEELAGNDPNRNSFFRSHPTSPERTVDTAKYARLLEVAPDRRIARTPAEFYARLDGLALGPSASGGVFVDNRFLQPDLRIGVDFPPEWKTVNDPQMVVAHTDDESAIIALRIVEKGEDPHATLARLSQGQKLLGPPRSLTVNGLPAVRAQAESGPRGHRVRTLVLLVAHGGLIYQVTAVCEPKQWNEFWDAFDRSLDSFHILSEEELAEVMQDRLRTATAERGERIPDFVERTGSSWSPDQLAVANGIEAALGLKAGQLLKLSKPERYEPRPRPDVAETAPDA